ncbi:MAG: PDZ domain-containing protein [Candidatus Zixiibacteriota bacterium]
MTDVMTTIHPRPGSQNSRVATRPRRWFTEALTLALAATTFALAGLAASSSAQEFDFRKLRAKAEKYTVIVSATVSVSMGAEPFESKVRGLGVVVSERGLVIIDASLVELGSGLASIYGGTSSFEVLKMNVQLLGGEKRPAEWLGSDRYSGVGFCQIESPASGVPERFDRVDFRPRRDFKVGEWVALFFLLPEYVEPPLAGDVGMITAVLTEPETSPLLVGFSESQTNSVIYDESGNAVGILGAVADPNSAVDLSDPSSFLGALGGSLPGYNLLGILTADRLRPLIDDPPRSGEKNRGWFGVSYQALNKDLVAYWGLDVKGGVILNEIVRNSPAEAAGVQVGDIVTAINGERLSVDREQNLAVFGRTISELGANAVVEFELLRRAQEGEFEILTLVAELGQAPITSSEADTYEDERFEFKARNLVFSDFLLYNLERETFSGVWVSEVSSGGWAALGGLLPGDIVQLVNSVKIESVANLREQLGRISENEVAEVVFFVWRDNKTLFVNIKPNWKDES